MGLLACVALDPAGIGEFVDALAGIGITQESKQVVGVPQGYAMMNAIKTAERKLANGTLTHSVNACMDWAIRQFEDRADGDRNPGDETTRRRREDRSGHGALRCRLCDADKSGNARVRL
jgi:phage terminase large subunit-like protein